MKKIISLWLKSLLFVNLFIFFFVFYFSTIDQHQFHIDEYLFLRKSYFFDLFLKRDFQNQLWRQENFDQPRLGPYIYGFALHLKGIKDIVFWQEQAGFNQIEIKGRVWWEEMFLKKLTDFPFELKPAAALIIYGRKVAAIFGLGCLLLLLLWLILLKKAQFGFWATLLLGVNRLMLYYARVAMTDAFQLFFFFLNLVLLTWYLQSYFQKNKQRFLFLSLAIATTAAAAAGVKVIGVLSLLYALVINLFLTLLNRQKKHFRPRVLGLSFLLILIIFYFLFLFLNPQIYTQPVRGFWQMFSLRWQSSLEYQVQGPGRPINNKLEALISIFEKIFLSANKFGNFGWLLLIPLDLITFSLGMGLLVKKVKEQLENQRSLEIEFVLITWWLSCFLSLIFYLKNDWPRFYLPLTAATTLVQAYFLAWGGEKLWRFCKKSLIVSKHRNKVFFRICKSVRKLTCLT